MRLACLVCSSAVLLGGCATPPLLPWEDPSLLELTAPTLRRFESREAFDDYLRNLAAASEASGVWRASTLRLDSSQFLAQLEPSSQLPLCDPAIEDCAEEILVTASAAQATSSITNNQEPNVDEGDIVKTFGRYIVVLQDGRLFSIDTGSTASNLSLVDRIDVYRDPRIFTWYDELLIHDDILVVTGYSYEQEATEFVVFEIDESGIFNHRVTYYIGSNDYYSGENYASRLVDGSLVLYTPIFLADFNIPDDEVTLPRIRHWTEDAGYSDWRPLFDVEDIYQPILQSFDPAVHSITICPISLERDWECSSTGFVGPWERELYVTADFAYLWNSSGPYDWIPWRDIEDCSETSLPLGGDPSPAALYRVPLARNGQETTAVLVAGVPDSQFALDARDDEFLALLYWAPGHCYWDIESVPMRYLRFPSSAFGTVVRELPIRSYHDVPRPTGSGLQDRFTEDYLVYSGSQGHWMAYLDDQSQYMPTELIVVPIDDPNGLRTIPLAHSAERVELFGDNIVVDGYQVNTGLTISTLDLRGGEPHLADQVYLDRVLESEGRSHAFNYVVERDGSGVVGLPTLFKESNNRRFWDRPSNVHFLRVDSDLRIQPSGHLEAYEEAEDPAYSCEVSCYDWYGNARPIFFRDRIFALSGTELIEGRFVGGQITEIGRVNMTATPLNPRFGE